MKKLPLLLFAFTPTLIAADIHERAVAASPLAG
jgi:hypothetical protein